jgi:hypothetical protein
MSPSACAAFCGTVIAFPNIVMLRYVAPSTTVPLAFSPRIAGRSVPPDPYPPRSASLT